MSDITPSSTIDCQTAVLTQVNHQPAVIESTSSNIPALSIVSILLVIAGWFVVYRNAKRLATRNETKSILDSALSALDCLENLAVDYWLSGRQKRKDTDEFILLISAKLLTFHNRLELLKKRKVRTEIIDLSELATLMTIDCEDVDRMQADNRRERVQEILDSTNNIHSLLYEEFHRMYRPSHRILSKD